MCFLSFSDQINILWKKGMRSNVGCDVHINTLSFWCLHSWLWTDFAQCSGISIANLSKDVLPKKFMFNQSNKLEMNKYSLGNNDDDKSDCDDFLLFLQTKVKGLCFQSGLSSEWNVSQKIARYLPGNSIRAPVRVLIWFFFLMEWFYMTFYSFLWII